ncbi:hypothetical protein [Paenibacillus spongiae]|uniref:Uncharacterized protein n=1 Tax=Paenibacillus spongiae TaxID=2909671 RepID=A0ABY5S4S7_9BACL|nr:hypothetical protein [Paenibacillus spongiae]UVI28595.1 hypothetical protein L1F29_24555 [Paenibacillus spongiae]
MDLMSDNNKSNRDETAYGPDVIHVIPDPGHKDISSTELIEPIIEQIMNNIQKSLLFGDDDEQK